MASASAYQDYIQTKLNPILESLVTELLLDHPDDPVMFMISKLCQRAGIEDPTAGPLRQTEDLKNEIAHLREEVQNAMKHNQNPQHELQTSTRSEHDSDESDEGESEDDDDGEFDDRINKLHGFNKMRQSVCAEVYGQWNQKTQFTLPVYEKTDEQKKELEKILTNSFMFSNLDEKDRNSVIMAMKGRVIPESMTLMRQGEDGDCLYIVEKGSLNCIREENGEKKVVKTVGPGDVFGELALLYNAPRAATVESLSECKVWKLDRDTFNAIVKEAATKKRELYDSFLTKVPLLTNMNAYDRTKVADALRTETYKDGEFIVREGEEGDTFYMVEEGNAVALKTFDGKVEEVQIYQVGDYFGELALITGDPRAASVKAKGDCKLATLDRKSFKRLLGSVELILKKKAQEYKRA